MDYSSNSLLYCQLNEDTLKKMLDILNSLSKKSLDLEQIKIGYTQLYLISQIFLEKVPTNLTNCLSGQSFRIQLLKTEAKFLEKLTRNSIGVFSPENNLPHYHDLKKPFTAIELFEQKLHSIVKKYESLEKNENFPSESNPNLKLILAHKLLNKLELLAHHAASVTREIPHLALAKIPERAGLVIRKIVNQNYPGTVFELNKNCSLCNSHICQKCDNAFEDHERLSFKMQGNVHLQILNYKKKKELQQKFEQNRSKILEHDQRTILKRVQYRSLREKLKLLRAQNEIFEVKNKQLGDAIEELRLQNSTLLDLLDNKKKEILQLDYKIKSSERNRRIDLFKLYSLRLKILGIFEESFSKRHSGLIEEVFHVSLNKGIADFWIIFQVLINLSRILFGESDLKGYEIIEQGSLSCWKIKENLVRNTEKSLRAKYVIWNDQKYVLDFFDSILSKFPNYEFKLWSNNNFLEFFQRLLAVRKNDEKEWYSIF